MDTARGDFHVVLLKLFYTGSGPFNASAVYGVGPLGIGAGYVTPGGDGGYEP